MNTNLKKIIICIIIGVVFLFIGFGFRYFYLSPIISDYNKSVDYVSDIKNDIDNENVKLKSLEASSDNSVTGVNLARVSKDEKVMSDYFTKIFTWSDNNDTAKKECSEVFGENVADKLFGDNIKSDKDVALGSKLDTVRLYPTKIAGKNYIYKGVIDYTLNYGSGNAKNTNHKYVIIYTSLDGQNKITEMQMIGMTDSE